MKDFGRGWNGNYTFIINGKFNLFELAVGGEHLDFCDLSVGYKGHLIEIVKTNVEEATEDVAAWKLARLNVNLSVVGVINRYLSALLHKRNYLLFTGCAEVGEGFTIGEIGVGSSAEHDGSAAERVFV